MSKTPKTASVAVDPSQAKVFDLADLDADDMKESFIQVQKRRQKELKEASEVTLASYPLIAKLKGHKNQDAPSVCYIPHSNCLVSAEKSVRGNPSSKDPSDRPRNDDPSYPINPKMA
jgi:hypothetical protein